MLFNTIEEYEKIHFVTYIYAFIAALILCGWFSIHTQAAITKGVKAPEQTVCFEPDTTSVLKNPLTGWVMYLGRAWDENFWQTQRYDAMPVMVGIPLFV